MKVIQNYKKLILSMLLMVAPVNMYAGFWSSLSKRAKKTNGLVVSGLAAIGGFLGYKKYKKKKKKKKQQKRLARARREAEFQASEQNDAALSIQNAFRQRKAKQVMHNLRQEDAALTVQTRYRQTRAQKELQRAREEVAEKKPELVIKPKPWQTLPKSESITISTGDKKEEESSILSCVIEDYIPKPLPKKDASIDMSAYDLVEDDAEYRNANEYYNDLMQLSAYLKGNGVFSFGHLDKYSFLEELDTLQRSLDGKISRTTHGEFVLGALDYVVIDGAQVFIADERCARMFMSSEDDTAMLIKQLRSARTIVEALRGNYGYIRSLFEQHITLEENVTLGSVYDEVIRINNEIAVPFNSKNVSELTPVEVQQASYCLGQLQALTDVVSSLSDVETIRHRYEVELLEYNTGFTDDITKLYEYLGISFKNGKKMLAYDVNALIQQKINDSSDDNEKIFLRQLGLLRKPLMKKEYEAYCSGTLDSLYDETKVKNTQVIHANLIQYFSNLLIELGVLG